MEAVRVRKLTDRRCARAWVLSVALAVGGCGDSFNLLGGNSSRPTLNLGTLGVGDDTTHYEEAENNAFEDAEWVGLASGSRVIRGTVNGTSDVDVYDLGPISRGTRIVVEMTAADSLDGALAIFDDTGATLLVNDHRNAYLGRKDPFIDVVSRRDSSACLVAVSATPGYSALGNYALLASRQDGAAVPSSQSDTVLLVFTGGSNVRIGGRAAVNVPAFDAADIGSSFAGQTSAIMAQVLASVREDYEGLNVTIYSTSEGTQWDGVMTRVFFGTYDPGLLGVAEGVDEYNSTNAQEAIIFTDTFGAFMQLDPSVSEISAALTNVTSHEIGHLLGLVHTADPEGVMDVTASLNRLLIDQDFRKSELYADVFPVGDQNALQCLMDSIGGTVDLAAFKAYYKSAAYSKTFFEDEGPSAREGLLLSGCDLKTHDH